MPQPQLSPAIPILRTFDATRAHEFYIDFLGFTIDWEHRFAPGMPLYLQISRDGLTLHLSEHHGDGTPGTTVFVPVEGIRAWQQELIAKGYGYARPEVVDVPWGRQMEIADPFGNRLRFCELSDD
ncbi:VOC family protein [Pseudoduganella plicata]|nr:VOC family protein [Pseudoduganella plicata]